MNLWLAFVTVGATTGLAIGGLLWIRHRSPHGGHFGDTSRAAGLFSILATTFAVLFAFVVFLSFNAYDKTRAGASTEATTLLQQLETVQFLPASVAPQLSGELVCYGRAVVHQEWPRIGASGIIPAPMWFAFLVTAGIVWGFVFFFADRAERALIQAVQIGAVTAMLTSSLLLVHFLDRPFHAGAVSIRPVAMEQSLRRMAETESAFGLHVPELCDVQGRPASSGAP